MLTNTHLGHYPHTKVYPLVNIEKDSQAKEQSAQGGNNYAKTLIFQVIIKECDLNHLVNKEHS